MANQVVATIVEQIGNKAFYMMGAKQLVADGNALQFKIRGCRKISHIRVELNALDTYDVTFSKFNGKTYDFKEIKKFEGAYADMLHDLFESTTGLYMSL